MLETATLCKRTIKKHIWIAKWVLCLVLPAAPKEEKKNESKTKQTKDSQLGGGGSVADVGYDIVSLTTTGTETNLENALGCACVQERHWLEGYRFRFYLWTSLADI